MENSPGVQAIFGRRGRQREGWVRREKGEHREGRKERGRGEGFVRRINSGIKMMKNVRTISFLPGLLILSISHMKNSLLKIKGKANGFLYAADA